MTLARDLLEQARHLATKEPKKPRQASLRRAISTAYYALFHLLVDDAAKVIATGAELKGVRQLTSRAFVHAEMKEASRSFAGGTLPENVDAALGSPQIPLDLKAVADAFQELQQARHEADYDTSRSFARREALTLMEQAERAFLSWQRVRATSLGKCYLHSLLAWNKWRK